MKVLLLSNYNYLSHLESLQNFHFMSLGSLFGIYHENIRDFYANLWQQNSLKLFLALPLVNGEPYFLGHTFMYDIFIQERYSPNKII